MISKKRKQFISIKARMIVSFCLLFITILVAIAIMDLLGIPFTSYFGRHNELKSKALTELNLIADLKKRRLLDWIKERRNDIHAISKNSCTASRISELLTTAEKTAGNNKKLWNRVSNRNNYINLLSYLEDLRVTGGVYSGIKIADAETGIIFFSTDKKELGDNMADSPYFSDHSPANDNYEDNIVFTYLRKKPILHFSHVIRNETGKTTAVLVMEVNTDDIIKPILDIGKGLGEKAEVLLVNKKGNLITSLKHPRPEGNMAELFKHRINFEPAILAAGGKEGDIDTEDYRGEPVLAAYRYLKVNPQAGWGMVVKLDKSELFEPLRLDIIYTFLIGIAGVLVFSGFTIFLSKKITTPIHSLSLTADKVSEGHLDARTPVGIQDEVGTLALTFNSMVERIQNWQKELEEKVSDRTAELLLANEKLLKYQEQLRLMASELSMTEERERRHIASELHDNIVQNLAFSRIKLVTLNKNSSSREMNAAFQEIIELIDQTIQSSRSLTFEISPPILYELGFEKAVEWLTGQFSRQHNISITFKNDGQPKPLEDETKILLFRSVRELLVNAIKHAQAKKIQVFLERKGSSILVKVEDDGIGLDPSPVLSRIDRNSGFGLFSIRDRLDYHGGGLELESIQGKGTRATITAPLSSDNEIFS